jgi:hypothetical protein
MAMMVFSTGSLQIRASTRLGEEWWRREMEWRRARVAGLAAADDFIEWRRGSSDVPSRSFRRGTHRIAAVQLEEERRQRWASREEKKWAAGHNRKREVSLLLKIFYFELLLKLDEKRKRFLAKIQSKLEAS